MGDKSAIEWTDATWNPVTGCSRVSPGCENCYAERLAGGRLRNSPRYQGTAEATAAGPRWTGELRFHTDVLELPLRWTKPRRVFVNSMSDLFHEDIPDEFVDRVFAVMGLASSHTFQVLTKRPERMRKYVESLISGQRKVGDALRALEREGIFDRLALASAFGVEAGSGEGDPPYTPFPNLWLGVSVEDQERYDVRVPELIETPAAVRFISLEPLLGPIDFMDGPTSPDSTMAPWSELDLGQIHWVIAGGESGPGARPMHPDWVRSIRDECTASSVPFFFKQWGEWAPMPGSGHGGHGWMDSVGWWSRPEHRTGTERKLYRTGDEAFIGGITTGVAADSHMVRIGKKRAGRELDGRTWEEMPE